MSTFFGNAKASSRSEFPLSITLENVTVIVESYENNKIFDCSNCNRLNRNSVCACREQAALEPNPRKHLRAVALIVHIINASDYDIDAYYNSWKMIDSQGYSFDGLWICDYFCSRRLKSAETVLRSTQARQIVLFPELEEGIVASQFILSTGQREFRFEVAELSESVRYLLKPPKPQDSITDKVNAYIKSDSYRVFFNALQDKHLVLEPEVLDSVIANLASNYYRFMGNSQNAWENEKQLLEHYPFIVSIADICTFEFAQKTIITIPNRAVSTCESIIEEYNVDYSVYPIQIFGQSLSAITFIEVFLSDDEMHSAPNTICHKVWHRIEDSKIKCGICSLTKNKFSNSDPSRIWLSCGRELDLSEVGRGANAGYREDLEDSFRSSWEANVARVLRRANTKYDYEAKTFQMKKYSYLPDFVLEDGSILEVKGIWDIDSLGKIKEIHKTFPDLKILTLDSEMYYDLDKKYHHLPGWEHSPVSVRNNTIPVVGLSFVQDQTVFDSLDIGTSVLLVREPENKFDNYAILVTSMEGKPIGHVSAEWAVVYAPKMDAGAKYEATIKEISPKVIKVEVGRTNLDQEVLYSCFG